MAGTNNPVSGSRKTGALALVAYPADYRTSGVMTFIVTKDGKVYEKDLGSRTTTQQETLKGGPDSRAGIPAGGVKQARDLTKQVL